MDKELKARKLGSATVRKQRMQERQRQKELLYEQREERKKRMMRYSAAYTTDDSDSSRSNSPENDSAADTPSECSVATPDNSTSPEIEIRLQETSPRKEPISGKGSIGDVLVADPLLDSRREKSTAPMFTASLNRPCDFRYDRFSTFMGSVEAIKSDESDVSSSSEDEEEEDSEDEYSPIEIATPVAIRMPISRPSVISVVTTPSSEQTPQKFSVKNINTIMINQPKPKLQTQDLTEIPQSTDSAPHLLPETKSVEALTPSSASIISVAPSSSQSLASTEQSIADNNLKKKPSVPMLSRAHARMNSIKNFIKPQSISGPPPAVPMIPVNHQPRPSESLNNILLSSNTPSKSTNLAVIQQDRMSARRSLTEPAFLNTLPREASRPQTARTVSNTTISTPEPPLPAYRPISPPPPPEPVTPADQADSPSMSRKKSFSNLRRRSGSLGQALKFSSGKAKSSAFEIPPPPVPAIRISSNESLPINFPTPPPPKTPRSFRKSGMNLYSAFPSPAQRGDPVGLGLKM